ncbi:hypothetical protein [Burkholderia ubonensis]|uniref:hypothetical protein n=1 Tax=Burkholderia ubonensis TaxID=101571 RepID=UPI00075ADE48|nr:hypothetical protein [Burkholderia ubonensis]KVO88538.1 hypothetical protein WJ80_07795 [Burkholderia ubonensis]
MAELQKINLGTAPAGRDGDPARTANQKMNDNVDVLSVQAALTTAPMITASQTLSADHIGRRVSVNIAAGGTVKMRKASLCEADSIVWLINVGAKRVLLAPSDGSGDSLSISGIGAGEAVALDTDGVSAWRVLMRGRPSSDDESVSGKLSVASDLSVTGAATFSGTATFSGGSKFSDRPTFAGKTPWDSGNFDPSNYTTVNTIQVLTARKRIKANQATYNWDDQTFVVESDFGQTGIGFRASTGAAILRYNNSNGALECVSWNSGVYGSMVAAAFNVGSDYRLKNVVGEIVDPIERVRKFKPVMAEYKASPGNPYPMFIAHVLQKAAPHAVSGVKDAVTEDGAPMHQFVDYSKVTPDLAAAIIALADENAELKARVKGIEEKIGVSQE